MNKTIGETEMVDFITSDNSMTLIYQRKAVVDEMFSIVRISASENCGYISFTIGWDESHILEQFTMSMDYSSYNSAYLIPAGETMNFYIATDNPSFGRFSFDFYPATEKSITFNLPAGSEQRSFLTSVSVDTYGCFTLALLESSEYPVTAEVEDPDGVVIGSYLFDMPNNQNISEGSWDSRQSDFTMQPGLTYNLYVINSSLTGNSIEGSFYLQYWESFSDYASFTLPEDTSSHTVYTRTSPCNELLSVTNFMNITSLPITIEVNNGSQVVQHTYTYDTENWAPDISFVLNQGQESTFSLINGTSPLTEISGELYLYFEEA